VTVKGTTPDGPVELAIPVTAAKPGALIHTLAARKLIQDLEENKSYIPDALGKADEKPPQSLVKEQIVRLGKKYHLSSNHTSWVVVDDQTVVDTPAPACEEVSLKKAFGSFGTSLFGASAPPPPPARFGGCPPPPPPPSGFSFGAAPAPASFGGCPPPPPHSFSFGAAPAPASSGGFGASIPTGAPYTANIKSRSSGFEKLFGATSTTSTIGSAASYPQQQQQQQQQQQMDEIDCEDSDGWGIPDSPTNTPTSPGSPSYSPTSPGYTPTSPGVARKRAAAPQSQPTTTMSEKDKLHNIVRHQAFNGSFPCVESLANLLRTTCAQINGLLQPLVAKYPSAAQHLPTIFVTLAVLAVLERAADPSHDMIREKATKYLSSSVGSAGLGGDSKVPWLGEWVCDACQSVASVEKGYDGGRNRCNECGDFDLCDGCFTKGIRCGNAGHTCKEVERLKVVDWLKKEAGKVLE